jgi:hypothetical protein
MLLPYHPLLLLLLLLLLPVGKQPSQEPPAGNASGKLTACCTTKCIDKRAGARKPLNALKASFVTCSTHFWGVSASHPYFQPEVRGDTGRH